MASRIGRALAPTLFAGLLLVVPAGTTAETGPEALADGLATWIVDQYPDYRDLQKNRALAACIGWDWATPEGAPVPSVHWVSQTTILGGSSSSPSELMNQAMESCATAQAEDAVCECSRVAIGKEPVLEVPERIIARLLQPRREWVSYDTEFKDRSALADIAFTGLEPETDAPLAPLTNVSLAREGLYVALRWGQGIPANASYLVRYQMIDPAGDLQEHSDQLLRPAENAVKGWRYFQIRGRMRMPGLWRVAILLDGETVAERPLMILPAH